MANILLFVVLQKELEIIYFYCKAHYVLDDVEDGGEDLLPLRLDDVVEHVDGGVGGLDLVDVDLQLGGEDLHVLAGELDPRGSFVLRHVGEVLDEPLIQHLVLVVVQNRNLTFRFLLNGAIQNLPL